MDLPFVSQIDLSLSPSSVVPNHEPALKQLLASASHGAGKLYSHLCFGSSQEEGSLPNNHRLLER